MLSNRALRKPIPLYVRRPFDSPEFDGMGTTLVAATVGRPVSSSVGEMLATVARTAFPAATFDLTKDHTWVTEVGSRSGFKRRCAETAPDEARPDHGHRCRGRYPHEFSCS